MAKEPKKETPPDTSKDDSILGSLCELGNSLGDMILSPIEEAIKEVAKPGKDDKETPEVKPAAKEKSTDGNGNDKHSISINLGGFFQSDKPDKRAAATAQKKGKAPRVEEPDESDEPADE